MPKWFLFALIGPLLWGLVNHADRYLLSRHYKGNGVGAILIFSSLFSGILLLVIPFILKIPVLGVSARDIAILILTGILGAIGFGLYLYALDVEETSIVIPFLQMGPVFGYFFGFIFLGELLSTQQILASILILVGVGTLSFDIDLENKITFKRQMILLATGASLFFALQDTVFKTVALTETFWTAAFWEYLGLALSGFFILIFFPKLRRQFTAIFSGRQYRLIAANFGSEALYLVGNLASSFAMLLAPVALVMVVGSYQPLFVLITGVVGTYLFPRFFDEKVGRKKLVQKTISVVIIVLGLYLSAILRAYD